MKEWRRQMELDEKLEKKNWENKMGKLRERWEDAKNSTSLIESLESQIKDLELELKEEKSDHKASRNNLQKKLDSLE